MLFLEKSQRFWVRIGTKFPDQKGPKKQIKFFQLFMEMDPREIEPLLREIFDLNPGNNMPAFFLP